MPEPEPPQKPRTFTERSEEITEWLRTSGLLLNEIEITKGIEPKPE